MLEHKLEFKRELENVVKGYVPVTKAVSGFFNSIEVLLRRRAGYRVDGRGGIKEYIYDRVEAQKIIRDRGRAIFLGDVGIGKTSIVLQESIKLADKLDKEYVMVNELLARYGKEKLLEVFEKAAENPEEYFFVSFVSLGMSAREELTGIPLLELEMPLPYLPELVIAREAYGLSDESFLSATKRSEKIARILDTERKITKTPVTLPTLPLSLDILTKSGIWGMLIIDDITNHKRDEDLMNFISSVMGHRRISGISSIELSPYVIIIGTGNLREHSELAYDLPPNIAGRVSIYCVGMPTAKDFEEYMLRQASRYKLNKKILSLILKLFNEKSSLSGRILTGKKAREYQNAMDTPRAWERFFFDASLWIEAYEARGGNGIADIEELKLIIRNIFVMTVGRDDLVDIVLKYLFTEMPSFADIARNPEMAYYSFARDIRRDIDSLFGYGVEVATGIQSIISKYMRLIRIQEGMRERVKLVFSGNGKRIDIYKAGFIKRKLFEKLSRARREELEDLHKKLLEENTVYRDLFYGTEDDEILGKILVDFASRHQELMDVSLNITWSLIREDLVDKYAKSYKAARIPVMLHEIMAMRSFLVSVLLGSTVTYIVRMKRDIDSLRAIIKSLKLILTVA